MKLFRNLLVAMILAAASLAVWADKINININEADAETLTMLNGIGAAKAEAIVKYRKSSGRFETLEDLTKVQGIGLATVEKNRREMTVDDDDEGGRRHVSVD